MDSGRTIRVSFEVVPDDVERLVRYLYQRPKGLRQALWRWALFLAWVPVLPFLPSLSTGQPIEPAHWLVAVFAALVLALILLGIRGHALTRWRELAHGPQSWLYLGACEISIAPDGLRWRSPTVTGRVAWPLVQAVEEFEDAIYLAISDQGAVRIPRRAFETMEACADCYSTIMEYRRREQDPVTECPRCRYDLSELRDAGCPECGWQRASMTNED